MESANTGPLSSGQLLKTSSLPREVVGYGYGYMVEMRTYICTLFYNSLVSINSNLRTGVVAVVA